MSNLIGQTLGPYRIIEQIGIGGMATVYKGYQPSMDRYVAVKVLPVLVSRDPAFLKRFRREAKVVAKLEHKHILPVYDYGEQEGLTYLVMRYVEAGTLKDRLAAGQLDLPQIYRIIAQVGTALDYAHRLGVIHRDVKPSNVLIDSQGDAYLTDFGLARIMESSEQLTATGVGVGTPDYMAPEQGQGLKIDHRSDIYSLGVMLYEMVTGRVPYEAETPMAVVIKHISAPLPLPSSVKPDIPQQVERVILKAMAKNPDDRFQTVGEMVEALDLAVRAATAAAPAAAQVDREVVPPVSAAPARKFRWPWDVQTTALGVGIAALALLVIGGMFFALSRIQYRVQVVGGRVEVVSVSTEAVTPTSAVALVETPTSEVALGTPTMTPTPTSSVTPTMTATPVPPTGTPTQTPTPSPTPTATTTPTPTSTPTGTPTATTTPTPYPTTTPITAFIPSVAEGIRFTAEISGIHRFKIISGAILNCPLGVNPADPYCGTWRSFLMVYKNRDIDFRGPNPTHQGGPMPINWDYFIGINRPFETAAEAENEGVGASVDIPLAQGNYVVIAANDCQGCYHDNQGGITLSVSVIAQLP